MNFFEQQDKARKKTGLLIFLFMLSVAFLIAATCLLVAATFAYTQPATHQPISALTNQSFFQLWTQLPTDLLLTIAFAIIFIVGLGSLYKMVQLSSGGEVVANMLGGRLLNTHTRNTDEKKLLNVVEEMAIASGLPVPPVYLLDEPGINAFAAGTQPHNAVIGITQGAIEQLDRNELQGVIAHEFSHIFNGDMRMNIRLMGVLNGILIFGIIGYFLLRVSSRGGMRSSRNNNSAMPFLILGAGLIIIGFGGTFFGNLIKSAVSRQREFLADASAVQFTRNPEGIASALKKIGGFSAESKIEHPGGQEVSHMFFSQAVSFFMPGLFATHPPLAERIRRIDQSWSENPHTNNSSSTTNNESSIHNADQQVNNLATGFNSSKPITAEQLSESVINNASVFDTSQNNYAQLLIANLPNTVIQAAHESYGASALVYGLLLDKNNAIRKKQLQHLHEKTDSIVYHMVEALYADMLTINQQSLTVLDLLLPALKQLSSQQYQNFKQILLVLIHADNKVELFEWSLFSIVTKHLEPKSSFLKRSRTVGNITLLSKPVSIVLSAVAYSGVYASLYTHVQSKNPDKEQAVNSSFNSAAKILGMPHLLLLPREHLTVDGFSKALQQLENLTPLQKPRLLKSLTQAIAHDSIIEPLEMQIFRAIAQHLDCPMSPLIVNT